MWAKRKLTTAFHELLLEIPANSITIKKVCEKAGVSRPSFYYHFNDLNELAFTLMRDLIQTDVRMHGTKKRWREGFYSILVLLRENGAIVQNLYDSKFRERVFELSSQELQKVLLHILWEDEKELGATVAPEDEQFIINFINSMLTSVISLYVRDGMTADPAKIAIQSKALLDGSIMRALKATISKGDVTS